MMSQANFVSPKGNEGGHHDRDTHSSQISFGKSASPLNFTRTFTSLKKSERGLHLKEGLPGYSVSPSSGPFKFGSDAKSTRSTLVPEIDVQNSREDLIKRVYARNAGNRAGTVRNGVRVKRQITEPLEIETVDSRDEKSVVEKLLIKTESSSHLRHPVPIVLPKCDVSIKVQHENSGKQRTEHCLEGKPPRVSNLKQTLKLYGIIHQKNIVIMSPVTAKNRVMSQSEHQLQF
jgi:hypothetical protein